VTIVGTTVPYYLEAGFGERVVLLLHGIGGGHRVFAPQMQALSGAGWRAMAWDMPGYGYSRTVTPYDLATLADSCLELIELQDARELVLVGHSMGGMVAQEVVAQAPEAVAGLVLAGTTAAFGKPAGAWQQEFLKSRTAPLDAGGSMAELARELVPGLVAESCDSAVLAEAIAGMAAVPQATYRHALEALVAFDRRAELAAIGVPTLVVAGALDRNAPPEVVEKMAQRIPGARYAVIPDAGHLMYSEQPALFNAVLLAFLADVFPPHAAPPGP
jgi:pimeloyl-ACP methyl ester carboxylesterase